MKVSVICLALVGLTPLSVYADIVTGYVNDPTGDSSDFATGVATLGGSVTVLNVGSLSTGALNPAAFLISNGVTLTGTGNFTVVSPGPGPADGNTFSTPLSNGEGVHPAVNDIGDGSLSGSLTVSFNTPVLGAGLFLIDLFNPFGDDDVTIQAFTGANGTGTSLGTFHDADFNFQNNHLYFMGVSSSGGDIGSITLNQVGGLGDHIALGNIEYAQGAPAVPEPSSVIFLITVLGVLGLILHRRFGCAGIAGQ